MSENRLALLYIGASLSLCMVSSFVTYVVLSRQVDCVPNYMMSCISETLPMMGKIVLAGIVGSIAGIFGMFIYRRFISSAEHKRKRGE